MVWPVGGAGTTPCDGACARGGEPPLAGALHKQRLHRFRRSVWPDRCAFDARYARERRSSIWLSHGRDAVHAMGRLVRVALCHCQRLVAHVRPGVEEMTQGNSKLSSLTTDV